MKTLILQDNSESTINLLIELAKKLGVKTAILTDDEREDIQLGLLMNDVKTGTLETEENIMKILKS